MLLAVRRAERAAVRGRTFELLSVLVDEGAGDAPPGGLRGHA